MTWCLGIWAGCGCQVSGAGGDPRGRERETYRDRRWRRARRRTSPLVRLRTRLSCRLRACTPCRPCRVPPWPLAACLCVCAAREQMCSPCSAVSRSSQLHSQRQVSVDVTRPVRSAPSRRPPARHTGTPATAWNTQKNMPERRGAKGAARCALRRRDMTAPPRSLSHRLHTVARASLPTGATRDASYMTTRLISLAPLVPFTVP